MEMFKFFVVVLLSLFAVSCQVHHIDTNQLIGKSKPEILEIVFAQTLKNDRGEVTIGFPSRMGWNIHLQYKNMESALNDKRLMESDEWEIDPRSRYKFPVYNELTVIILFFNGEIVEKFEYRGWQMT